MKHLSPGDRPREKLWRLGAPTLGDNELVALVIGSGRQHVDALAVANGLLTARGGLHGLARSTPADLTRVSGIGRVKAAQLLAALEMGRRTLAHAPAARLRLGAPHDAAAYLLPTFGSRPVEHFGVVLLDSRHRVIRTTVLAIGTLNTTIVEPRDVFREAVLESASAIVVFHNHPSGDPSPSADDVELTRRLAGAGVLMGIDVIDHVILGDARYCSFRQLGKL